MIRQLELDSWLGCDIYLVTKEGRCSLSKISIFERGKIVAVETHSVLLVMKNQLLYNTLISLTLCSNYVLSVSAAGGLLALLSTGSQ